MAFCYVALTSASVALSTRSACGAENVEEFIKALRSAGYYDMGVAYLNRIADRQDVDPKFKSRLPYELGTVLVESALATQDRMQRDKKLDQAQSKLREFVVANPDAALAATANFQLAGVLLLRGQALVARRRPPRRTRPSFAARRARSSTRRFRYLQGWRRAWLINSTNFPMIPPMKTRRSAANFRRRFSMRVCKSLKCCAKRPRLTMLVATTSKSAAGRFEQTIEDTSGIPGYRLEWGRFSGNGA